MKPQNNLNENQQSYEEKAYLKMSLRSLTFLLPDWFDLLSSKNALA